MSKQFIFSTDKVQCYFQMVVSFAKRMVKHRSSKYGWQIYNTCFHDECRKQGKFKQLDVVCYDHKSCVLASKYTINVPMMSAESKDNSNSWMWYALIIKTVF